MLVGSIPKAGIRFGLFGYLNDLLASPDGTSTAPRRLAAGMTAGAIEATLCVTPYETVKTKLIDGNAGMVRGIAGIVRREGVRGVYQGWGATVAKQSSNQGLRFMAFSQYKEALLRRANGGGGGAAEEEGEGRRAKLFAHEALLGGMLSGCFSTMCNNPFDMVKTRLQGLEAAQYDGMVDCFTTVLRKEGPGAFYKGVVPRLGRVVPGQGIIFMSYEKITEWLETLPIFARDDGGPDA